MSTSAARIGKGTTIGYGVDGTSPPGSFTAFLEVKKVNAPTQDVAKPKVTHYLSPSGAHEFLPGWLDAGEVSVEGNFINADMTVLTGMLQAFKWFKITLPLAGAEVTAATFVFRGFVSKLTSDLPNEEAIANKISIKISGPVTFTAAS